MSWRAGHRAVLPDASCEPDGRFIAADRQQLGVPAVPAVLLPEVRQQGETTCHSKQESENRKKQNIVAHNKIM